MSEAAGLLVMGLVAMIGVSPILSARHELTVRHVRCAEHGELTHVQASEGVSAEPTRTFSSVENEGADRVDGHDHCTNDFLVRGRMVVSIIRSLVRYTPPPAVAREVLDAAVVIPGRAFVLASAPKTSPPTTV
jgi:hypothetical protein